MTTKRQNLALCYFLMRSLFLGVGINSIINFSKQDSWITVILGLLFGLLIIIFFQHLVQLKGDKGIKEVLNNLKGWGVVLKILLLLFGGFFMFEALLILQTYTASFYLLHTPIIMITISVLILTFYICHKGLSTIGKVAEILLPISLFLYIIAIFALVPAIKLDNFLPILTRTPWRIIFEAMLVGITAATPVVLLIGTNENGKKLIPAYIINVLIILGVLICTLGVLGVTLANTYRFPEYMVLKRISLFDFIEKIENIISIQWVFDLLILTFVSGFLVKKMLPEKRNNWYFAFFLIGMTYLSTQIFGKNYSYDLFIMYKTPIILISILVICILPIFIYLMVKNKKSKSTKSDKLVQTSKN